VVGHAVDEILRMGVAEKTCNSRATRSKSAIISNNASQFALGSGPVKVRSSFTPGVTREMRFETLTEAPGLERPVVVALNVPLKQRDQVVESHVEIEYPFGGHRLTAQEALRDIGNSDQEVGNEAQTPSRPTAAVAGWGVRQGADIGAADGVRRSGVAASCADATWVSGTG
jgi:hypothetical protein